MTISLSVISRLVISRCHGCCGHCVSSVIPLIAYLLIWLHVRALGPLGAAVREFS